MVGMGGAYLSFSLLIILLPSLVNDTFAHKFKIALNIAAITLSSVSILQLLGVGPALLFNRLGAVDFPNSLAFSLAGASFIAIQFLSVVLVSNIFDQNLFKTSWVSKATVALSAIALSINIWAILPGGQASFQSLSLAASTNIARNSLTFTKNALFGYGPDSYGNAYNILKPVWVNGQSYWKFTFDSGFNLLLTIMVSLGLIAFLAYLWFLWQSASVLKADANGDAFVKSTVIALLIWQLLAPVNLLTLSLLAIGIGLLIKQNQGRYNNYTFEVHRLADFLTLGKFVKGRTYLFHGINSILLALALLALLGVSRAFGAYYLLYQSNAKITQNEIATAYDYHVQAKALAPELDFVRRSSALVNLQIAIALSNKADLSPAEQDQVLQLVNQAIREARAATVLDPQNYLNWSVLAQIYMQLVNTTDQAKQEAFNALAKAATNNPNNPEIRMALGQLFQNTNRLTEAISFFDQAIERKPDLFVAHYYMAQALIANKQVAEGRNYLISSLNLLAKDSEEYRAVEKELNKLVTEIEAAANTNTNTQENMAPINPVPPTDVPTSTSTATTSSLTEVLNQGSAEAIIQEGALSTEQSLVEN